MTSLTIYRPMQKIRTTFLFLVLSITVSYGQNSEVVKKYIEIYKDLAVREMLRTGVPASITLAQGIHESGAGNSKLALSSNNHFGIKCKSNWTGESVKHNDDAKGECFRKYPSPEDSYRDHSDFLKSSARYASLFTLDPEDYSGWANGLKKAGYATNPKYPQVLIKLVEDYQLQDYTLLALGKMKPKSDTAALAVEISTTAFIPDPPKTNKYPEVVFTINETKVIYAKKGTSFLSIAQKYDVDLSKIFEFNEMKQAEMLEKDQLVYLARKRKTGNNDFHIVQPGETMYDIAQAEAIRLQSLMELNWLKAGQTAAAGEKLSLKTKSSTIPRLAMKENYSLTQQGNQPK